MRSPWVTRHQEQAALLGLDKNLLWKVMNQLSEGEGYMDRHGRLTQKGQQILQKDGEEEEERTVYGWIFQEATAGELLPWFHTDKLHRADSSRSDIAPALQLPWIWKHLQPPNASDVTAAILKQRRLLKIQAVEPTKEQNTEPEDACEFTEVDKFIAPTSQPLERQDVQLPENFGVRFLSQKPEPERFYLLVRTSIAGSYDGQFSLRCPFGLNDGLRWVRLLNFAASQCAEGSQLVEHLRQCSCDAWKRCQPPDIDPAAVVRQVYDQVASVLGPQPDKLWQGVWQELERMEQSLLFLERGFDEVDTALTRSQRVLEQLMLSVIGLDSVPQDIWQKYNRQGALRECFRDTALACGVSLSDIPERLLTTSIGKVRAVLEGSKESLRPYVATLLLAASRRGSLHRSILEHVLREYPTFLSDIERVVDARNEFGAHAGGTHNTSITLVKDIVQIIYKIVRLLVAAWYPFRGGQEASIIWC